MLAWGGARLRFWTLKANTALFAADPIAVVDRIAIESSEAEALTRHIGWTG